MEKQNLGKAGIDVAPVAFGGNVFGWTIDENTSFQLLDAFTDAGFNLIDTADVYSTWVPGNYGGESEIIIGNWLKRSGKRDQVVIATKVGAEMSPGKKGLSKNYILAAVEASLTRLKTDYIDLYQSHDDLNTRVEEALEAYQILIKAGKVRMIGASNFEPQRLAEALQAGKQSDVPAYTTLQPHYNLYDREQYETQFAPLVSAYNLKVIPYYALASGFLTGKYRSDADLNKSQRGHGIKQYLNDRGFRILEALDQVAADTNAEVSEVALSWLIAQPHIAAAIASATSLKQLRSLVRAADLKLNQEAISLLDKASAY
jgi:aryl-alcohol dehydrogenase-like predicted oxidoreductase